MHANLSYFESRREMRIMVTIQNLSVYCFILIVVLCKLGWPPDIKDGKLSFIINA